MTQEKSFSEMNDTEKEEFIAKNKARSAAAYQKRQKDQEDISVARKAFKAKVHLGNRYLENEQAKIAQAKGGKTFIFDVFPVGPFQVNFGVLPISWTDEEIVCKAAYAIKSPTDKAITRIGMGLVGDRISKDNEWCATLTFPREIFECEDTTIKSAICGIITSRIICRAPEVPQRVINTLFGHTMKKWKEQNSICSPCGKPECQDCNPQ